MRTLAIAVHGESGVGKSWLGDSCPAPRLILDSEGGSTFTPSQKVLWDPIQTAPPEGYETVLTLIRDFPSMLRVFQWLNSGQHPFRSVVMDSLTEIQKRCMDAIAGTAQPKRQDWGQLLRDMEKLVRDFRDLKMHPIRPIEVVMILMTSSPKDGVIRPNVQGQLQLTLPQFMDVVGYMYVQADGTGNLQRQLLVQPYPGYVAKDRTDRLPPIVRDPDMGRIMEAIYGTS